MKKTILALALVSCGAAAVQAQDTLRTMNQNTGGINQTMDSTSQTVNMQGTNTDVGSTQTSLGSYNAYGPAVNVPSTTQAYLLRDHPTAMNATWEQSGEWYRANIASNNRNIQVYYAPNGASYSVALPVVHGWVPEEIITAAMTRYGNTIYGINRVKGANDKDMYQVTLLEGGMTRPEYLSEDGNSTVAMMEVFRTDSMQLNPNTGSWETNSTNAGMGSDSTNNKNWNNNKSNWNNNNRNKDSMHMNQQNQQMNSTMDSTGTGVQSDMSTGTGTDMNMNTNTGTNTDSSTLGTKTQSTESGMNPGTTNKTKKKTKRTTSSGTNQNQY